MNQYVTGTAIKSLREKKKLTQLQLAEKLGVTDKTISKWETGRGYPDITLLEPLADTLDVSITELISGNKIDNNNVSANMLKSKFYVCPICGNVIHSMGEMVINCHGIELSPLESESPDKNHDIVIEKIEHDYYINIQHEMTKSHYISFVAALTPSEVKIIKLYPEGNPEARIPTREVKAILYYCNKDGLFKVNPKEILKIDC